MHIRVHNKKSSALTLSSVVVVLCNVRQNDEDDEGVRLEASMRV